MYLRWIRVQDATPGALELNSLVKRSSFPWLMQLFEAIQPVKGLKVERLLVCSFSVCLDKNKLAYVIKLFCRQYYLEYHLDCVAQSDFSVALQYSICILNS